VPNPRAHELPQVNSEPEAELGANFPLPSTASHVAHRVGTSPEHVTGPELRLPPSSEPHPPQWYMDRIYSRGRSPDGLEIVRFTLQPAVANPDISYPLGPPQQVAGGRFGQRKVWMHNNSAAAAVVFAVSRAEILSGQNVYPLGPGADFDIDTESSVWMGNASTTTPVDVFVTRTYWKRPTPATTEVVTHREAPRRNGVFK